MHARVLAQHPARGIANLALRFFRGNAALAKVGIDERRVIAIWDETDLLAVGLGGHRQTQLARQLAHLRLGVSAQRKIRARQLMLLQAEEKIGLILGVVRAPAHLIAPAPVVKADARVVTGGDVRRAHALGHIQELIELDEIVAERARNGRAAGQIIVDERLDHLLFEAGLEVDHVIGDAEMLGHVARVIHVVERTAPAGGPALGREFRQSPLIPQLHGQAYNAPALTLQQSRDDGAIHSARHCHCDRRFGAGLIRHWCK